MPTRIKQNIIIATVHEWNIIHAQALRKVFPGVRIITNKDQLSLDLVKQINPKYIFFPHWSWRIPEDIYKNFTCVIFHMTDVPFGRGGTPLQNLIVRGFKTTKISALQAVAQMDAGPVFLKKSLSLKGTAEEIFHRAAGTIFEEMIPYILNRGPRPHLQKGKVVRFTRRTPQQSSLEGVDSLSKVFDHIRMLDAPGYPKAFLKSGNIKYEFSDACVGTSSITAKVQIKYE